MIRIYFCRCNYKDYPFRRLARVCLGSYLHTNSDLMVLRDNSFGKPFLEDFPDIHFSISHTKGLYVVAVSDMPIGVDAEKVRAIDMQVVNRFYSDHEQIYVLCGSGELDRRYTEIWTMKEAYAKWLGKDMKMLYERYDILGKKEIRLFLDEEYCMAVCMQEPAIKIEFIDIASMI